MRPAHQVYSSQLRELRHGYALWCPEPCLYDEVKVGDVGYLRDGAFHRLFNATLSADHPDQTLGVPTLFQPLILPTGWLWRNEKFFDPGNLRSTSVSEYRYGVSASGVVLPGGAGVHFSCSRNQGALLHLSKPAIREEALAREAFETYTLRNFPNWYEFANSVLLRGVRNGEIMFVTGCDKTFEWASAVFDDRSRDAGISLKADTLPGLSAELTLSARWDVTSSIQHRSGPTFEDNSMVKIDQTVFIRGYKILERKIRSPKVIRAEAEPRPPSPKEDQHDSSSLYTPESGASSQWVWSIESIREESPVYHPSDALLEHILEHSDDTVAIVHDDHWCGTAVHQALRGDAPSIEEIVAAYEERFFDDNESPGVQSTGDNIESQTPEEIPHPSLDTLDLSVYPMDPNPVRFYYSPHDGHISSHDAGSFPFGRNFSSHHSFSSCGQLLMEDYPLIPPCQPQPHPLLPASIYTESQQYDFAEDQNQKQQFRPSAPPPYSVEPSLLSHSRSNMFPPNFCPDAGDYLRQQLNLSPDVPVSLWSVPEPPSGEKPSIPMPMLIKLAIYGSQNRRLTLQEIYVELAARFQWFRDHEHDTTWKNTIRHNLSLNKVFKKIQRPIMEPGEGSYWELDISFGEDYKPPRKDRSPTVSLTVVNEDGISGDGSYSDNNRDGYSPNTLKRDIHTPRGSSVVN